MSGAGAPDLTVDATGAKVAIVASSWHTEVMDGLIAGAQTALAEANVTDVTLVRAPGSFELPLISPGVRDGTATTRSSRSASSSAAAHPTSSTSRQRPPTVSTGSPSTPACRSASAC